jgi:hypothetical protein
LLFSLFLPRAKADIIDVMLDTVTQIEAALATVQQVLDALTTRGDNQAAFDLAKAQYSASVRTSWPANLSSLLRPLEKVNADASLKLTEDERAQLGHVIDVLRRACDQ